MPNETIKEILMRRDGLSECDADDTITTAKEDLMDVIERGDFMEFEDFCQDHFGLEPDYIEELMPI